LLQRLRKFVIRHALHVGVQQVFLEGLAFWLEQGLDLRASLAQLADHAPRRIVRLFIPLVQKALATNQTFSAVLQPYYPPYVIEMVRTGESDEHFAKAIRAAAEVFAAQHLTFRAVFHGLIYPAVMLCAATGLAGSIHDSVFKDLSALQPLINWPFIGKVAYFISGFIQQFAWALASLALIVGMFGLYKLRKHLFAPQVFSFLRPLKNRKRIHDLLHHVKETMHENALEVRAVGSVVGNTLLAAGAVLALLLICAIYGVSVG